MNVILIIIRYHISMHRVAMLANVCKFAPNKNV